MLTATDLIQLGESLGFSVKNKFSYGFSMVKALSAVCFQEDFISECLQVITSRKGDLSGLIKELEEIHSTAKLKPTETEYPPIRLFYALIEAFLGPRPVAEFLQEKKIATRLIPIASTFLQPLKEKKINSLCLLEKNSSLNVNQLTEYLRSLAPIMLESHAVLVLSSIHHSVFLKASTISTWLLLDCNNLASQSPLLSYEVSLSHPELASALFCTFKTVETIVFNAKIFAKKVNPALLERFESFDLGYKIKPRQALSYDSHKASVLYLSC